MNKSFSLVLALSVLSAMGYAQTNLDSEVDAELDKMYSTQNQKVAPSTPAPAPVTAQPIYIVNQATPTATAQTSSAASSEVIQKQPTTVIEASPLTESRAEALRKARQEAESSTEMKIVEKLEASRLEDEKRRAQLLFGDKLANGTTQEASSSGAPAAPAVQPQIIIIPQAVPVAPPAPEAKKDEKKEESAQIVEPTVAPRVENEMAAAEKADIALSTQAAVIGVPKTQRYFSALVGAPVVDGTDLVDGNYALGFTVGNKYDETFAVEGSFMYSNYEARNAFNRSSPIGRPDLFDVNQYSGAIAGKWYLLSGVVKPVIGGLAQYSYRDFQWSEKNYVRPQSLGRSESHAVDLGALIGVEVEFSPTMTLGLETRYMRNLLVRRNYSTDNLNNSMFQNSVISRYGYRTPIEDLDYYTFSLTARVAF
jgi:hypothetical protein